MLTRSGAFAARSPDLDTPLHAEFSQYHYYIQKLIFLGIRKKMADLLNPASSFTLNIGGTVDFGNQWHYTYTISGLSEETEEPEGRRTFYQNRTDIPTISYEDIFKDIFTSGSVEDATARPRQHPKIKRKTLTPLTIKYERGMTGSQKKNSFKNHTPRLHKPKPLSILTRLHYTTYNNPYVLKTPIGHQPARNGYNVYMHVNNSDNAKGEKRQKIIIYNRTHYLQYKGKTTPSDNVKLNKLWSHQDSRSAKVFDEVFRPPFLLNRQNPTASLLRNGSSKYLNQPGSKPTPKVARKPFDLTKWFGDIWGKVTNYNSQETGMQSRPKPGGKAGDYIYTYVNSSVNEMGQKEHKIILYNKTHYLVYNREAVPQDYASLCKIWTQLEFAKEFDEVFSPPWRTRWDKPPPGLFKKATWEVSKQPGRKSDHLAPAVRTPFNITSWVENLWSHDYNNYQITSQKKIDKQPVVKLVPNVNTDNIYTYVNNSVDAKGVRSQQLILYNKTHYHRYTGNVIPANYVELCKLWSEQDSAKEFDDVFRPPWWMQWHKPPWWMNRHTPPPGMLSNDTWEIRNQPGMKRSGRNLPKTVNITFDLPKWVRQLWHNLNNDITKTSSEKKTDGSFRAPQLQHKNTKDKRHKFFNSHQLRINSHKVNYDQQINAFTNYILNSTLKLFDKVKERSPEREWQRELKGLAKTYGEEYKEYLRTIKHQHVYSELGIRKVILNAIDTSNRILKRLINLMMDDMGKKHLLRHSRTPDIFRKEISIESKGLLDSACVGLGICKSENGFIQLFLDVAAAMLKVSDEQFEQAFDAFTDACRNSDFFTRYMNSTSDSGIQSKFSILANLTVNLKRTLTVIIRNVIDNRNSPLSLPAAGKDSANSIIRSFSAFQDLIIMADEKVSSSPENVREWNQIRSDINDWTIGAGPSIETTMTRFVTHLNDCADRLDKETFEIMTDYMKKIFG